MGRRGHRVDFAPCPRSGLQVQWVVEIGRRGHRISGLLSAGDDNILLPIQEDAHRAQRPRLLLGSAGGPTSVSGRRRPVTNAPRRAPVLPAFQERLRSLDRRALEATDTLESEDHGLRAGTGRRSTPGPSGSSRRGRKWSRAPPPCRCSRLGPPPNR